MVAIRVSQNPGDAVLGETITTTIHYEFIGNILADTVVITNTVPDAFQLETIQIASWAERSGRTVTWRFSNNSPVPKQGTIMYNARVQTTTPRLSPNIPENRGYLLLTVFDDENRNKLFDTGEYGLDNVRFLLLNSDKLVKDDRTDNDGRSSVIVVPGDYEIVLPDHKYLPTGPNISTVSIDIMSGTIYEREFGFDVTDRDLNRPPVTPVPFVIRNKGAVAYWEVDSKIVVYQSEESVAIGNGINYYMPLLLR